MGLIDNSMTNVIYDVDLASDMKSFILNNSDDVSFDSPTLKKNIIDSNDDDLLRVGKTIDSPIRIVSVDIVDATFFKKNLFKDGNQN